jgi:hypothetical protein
LWEFVDTGRKIKIVWLFSGPDASGTLKSLAGKQAGSSSGLAT